MHDAEAVESAPESGAREELTLNGSAQARLEDQIAWCDAKGLVSQEHAARVSHREEAGKRIGDGE